MDKIYGKIKGDNNKTCKSHKYSKCFCVTGFGLFFKIPPKSSVCPKYELLDYEDVPIL